MRRHEPSNAEWELVRPLLPRPARGRPRLDDRTVLNGIVWKSGPGSRGGMCPSGTGRGPASTRVSTGGGGWHLRADAPGRPGQRGDTAGEIEWLESVDPTVVRAHQHAAVARERGS
ncbi:transposase [Streptomyces goshikiensis]|uniref:transposase n=1 Tax=Streptomyces goshikiensis TaxID=1942 RepID=UPI0036BEE59E